MPLSTLVLYRTVSRYLVLLEDRTFLTRVFLFQTLDGDAYEIKNLLWATPIRVPMYRETVIFCLTAVLTSIL